MLSAHFVHTSVQVETFAPLSLLKYLHFQAELMSTNVPLTIELNMQATSASFNPDSTRYATQLLAVLDASTQGLPSKSSRKYLRTFTKLFGGLLHPDATSRMTAAQMLKLLQSAALKSLKKSPFCI